ncbi:hypothetical protein GOV14_06325 [Candidatus Pacearchaeota archaeon]|nr:hypothetical protein [Candidatus Pacearchaeota archaeon]
MVQESERIGKKYTTKSGTVYYYIAQLDEERFASKHQWIRDSKDGKIKDIVGASYVSVDTCKDLIKKYRKNPQTSHKSLAEFIGNATDSNYSAMGGVLFIMSEVSKKDDHYKLFHSSLVEKIERLNEGDIEKILAKRIEDIMSEPDTSGKSTEIHLVSDE